MMKRILSGASQRQVNYGNITSGMPYVKGNSYVCIQKAMKQTTRNDMMNFFERYGAKPVSFHQEYDYGRTTGKWFIQFDSEHEARAFINQIKPSKMLGFREVFVRWSKKPEFDETNRLNPFGVDMTDKWSRTVLLSHLPYTMTHHDIMYSIASRFKVTSRDIQHLSAPGSRKYSLASSSGMALIHFENAEEAHRFYVEKHNTALGDRTLTVTVLH